MDNRFRVYYMVNLNKSRNITGQRYSDDSFGKTYEENIWTLQSMVNSLKMTPLKGHTEPRKYPEGYYQHYQMKISCKKDDEQTLLHILENAKDVECFKVC